MTAMENKDCEKEADVDQGWMIYFHTFLVGDCSGSWAARVGPETEVEEEERTWFIHLSKSTFLLVNIFVDLIEKIHLNHYLYLNCF